PRHFAAHSFRAQAERPVTPHAGSAYFSGTRVIPHSQCVPISRKTKQTGLKRVFQLKKHRKMKSLLPRAPPDVRVTKICRPWRRDQIYSPMLPDRYSTK